MEQQVWIPDSWTKFYTFSMCLLVFTTADVSWLMSVPRPLAFLLACISAVILIYKQGGCFSTGRMSFVLIWFVYILTNILTSSFTVVKFVFYLMLFFSMSSVAVLSIDRMKYLLKAINSCFVFILTVSLFGWILFLSGVPLPFTGPIYHADNFHVYNDYYFFTTSHLNRLYYRFSSIFLEPGQLATPCVFLFHLNTRNEKVFCYKNMILLVAIILSFSLISYGLLLLSFVVNTVSRNKEGGNKVVWLAVTLLLLGGVTWYFIAHEDNAVHTLIVSRLEYDEENNTISGYNRTGDNFEFEYALLMNTPNKYFGIGETLHKDDYDWTTHASGYKKFIVFHGIVGLAIVLLLLAVLVFYNFSKASLVFCVMVFLAFWVRNMLTTPLWLTITIIGMYLIGSDNGSLNLNTNYKFR